MHKEDIYSIDSSLFQDMCLVQGEISGENILAKDIAAKDIAAMSLADKNADVGSFYDVDGHICVDWAARGYFVLRLPKQHYKLKNEENEKEGDLCVFSRSFDAFDRIDPLRQEDAGGRHGGIDNKIAMARGRFWDSCDAEIRTAIGRFTRMLQADNWSVESHDIHINQNSQDAGNTNEKDFSKPICDPDPPIRSDFSLSHTDVPVIMAAFPEFLQDNSDYNLNLYYSYISKFYKLDLILFLFKFCLSYDGFNICFVTIFPPSFNIHRSIYFSNKLIKLLK